ncbi:MAG TPA: MFS transporter [Bacilli bacterium]|nr:MFS transporter [Bacilli bacterium]
MKKAKINSATRTALFFILIMGIVSLLSDMTHEGAKSIYGDFLRLNGASYFSISLISGLGEFLGSSLIFVTGYIASRTKKYWLMTFIGYAINMLAIPALALVMPGGYIWAGALIIAERIGKAIRKPAKNTMVSFVSHKMGVGKSFAMLEVLDQIGAFLGPVMLTGVLLLSKNEDTLTGYRLSFLFLLIPAILCLIFLFIARIKYPKPEDYETAEEVNSEEQLAGKNKQVFIIYIVASLLSAIAFLDFPLISAYISDQGYLSAEYLPLAYAFAMLIDAVGAFIFGLLFDRFGIRLLPYVSLLGVLLTPLIFLTHSLGSVAAGVAIWGLIMGANESVLKAAVATIVPKARRAWGYGLFEGLYGIAWFAGSVLIGLLIEKSITWMVIFCVAVSLLATVFYFMSAYIDSGKKITKEKIDG